MGIQARTKDAMLARVTADSGWLEEKSVVIQRGCDQWRCSHCQCSHQ